ncbi:MAG: hypothetical protein PHD67_00785 [Oscillospiraceae bacterium]|nr:hypothetical protein [Oscillospiraceae bacterium]
MKQRTKDPIRSGAPLAELIVAIGVFAFAGALALQLFVGARFTAEKARDMTRAVTVAQTLAERFKAGEAGAGAFYYDKNWEETVAPDLFEMELSVTQEDGLRRGEILVRRSRPYPFLKNDGGAVLLYTLETACYDQEGGGAA